MAHRMYGTCYESTSRVIAQGENLAASHGYKSQNINWTEVHWDFNARRLIEAAYFRSCAQHGDGEQLLSQFKECETRMIELYEGRRQPGQ